MGKRYKVGEVFFDACGDGLRRYTVTRANASALDAESVRVTPEGTAFGPSANWSGSNPPGLRTARDTKRKALACLVNALWEERELARAAALKAEEDYHAARADFKAAYYAETRTERPAELTPTEVAPDA